MVLKITITSLCNYVFFLKYVFLLLLIFNISRFLLVYTTGIELDALFFVYSLRMDIIVSSFLLIIPVIAYTFNLLSLTRLLLTISLFVVLYLEIANYFFFEEFGTRLNYLFIEYLEYPEAVFAMIWKSYKVHLIIMIPFLLYTTYQFFKLIKKDILQSRVLKKILLLPFILAFLFLGLRSSVDSSTPNQSFYSYSNSVTKNDLANNTIFSLAYATYLKSKDKMPNFGKKNDDLIQRIQGLHDTQYLSNKNLLHFQKSTFKKKDKIVVAIMESFGKSYVGSLGGTPTTPYFDKMSKEGLFLSNMYSSSNRSNRGFEAILSSLFPVYSNTYLKLPKSQQNFWTVAKTMKAQGYKTIFLYGGDSKFDNMKGFALSNGFERVVDKYDFDSSIKRYTWGVSDEELYKKANTILNSTKEPLFLVLFSLSSHKPFDYPDGKIKYYDKAEIESFENSMKYADYALHKFYTNLQKDDFFQSGLLTIVADHNAHMLGDHVMNVNEFKIPALFIADDVISQELKGVTHQIDIAPTLLDIAGLDAVVPVMGANLTKKESSSALIVRRGKYAYLKNDRYVIYQKKQTPLIYDFNYNKLESDNKFIEEGLDVIYGTYKIYNEKLHRGTE